jgi:acetyltransferase EpsM
VQLQPHAFTLLGIIDPLEPVDTARTLGVPWLGDDAAVAQFPEARMVLGIGPNGSALARRHAVVQKMANRQWASVIHPTAYVSRSAVIGDGAVVLPRAVVHARAHIGAWAIVNSGAIVEHDCDVGVHAVLSPGVVLGGGAHVGNDCFLGLGAVVRDHVRVGHRAVVGMGSVVLREVPAGTTFAGLPARALPRPNS